MSRVNKAMCIDGFGLMLGEPTSSILLDSCLESLLLVVVLLLRWGHRRKFHHLLRRVQHWCGGRGSNGLGVDCHGLLLPAVAALCAALRQHHSRRGHHLRLSDGGRVQLVERAGDQLQGLDRPAHRLLHHRDHGLHLQVDIIEALLVQATNLYCAVLCDIASRTASRRASSSSPGCARSASCSSKSASTSSWPGWSPRKNWMPPCHTLSCM